MSMAIFKTILVTLVSVGFTQAYAASSHNIAIDDFPYVGSLADSAKNVDTALVEEAGKACGSLDNIAGLSDVTLTMQNVSVPNGAINPKGTPGGKGHKAVFVFSYPRVTGSAVVTCIN